jgi:hypothetical protein
MKSAVALLALILATAIYVATYAKGPVPALAIERCHWHGDEAVNCQHIFSEPHWRTSRSSGAKKGILPL